MKPVKEIQAVELKNEALLFALMAIRGCETEEEIKAVLHDSRIYGRGLYEAVEEVLKTLPNTLEMLKRVYGKGGGEV